MKRKFEGQDRSLPKKKFKSQFKSGGSSKNHHLKSKKFTSKKKKVGDKKLANQLFGLIKDVQGKQTTNKKVPKEITTEQLSNKDEKLPKVMKPVNNDESSSKKSINNNKHLSASTSCSQTENTLDRTTSLKKKKISDGNGINKNIHQSKISSNKQDVCDKKPSEQKATEPVIWFDDVDEILIESSKPNDVTKSKKSLVKANSSNGITKVLGMDCEMVGVGKDGRDSILARVSIVNQFGHCVYDKFVKPTERVTDYRTKVSGIRPSDLRNGEDFKVVQKEVYDLINGKILVGHAISHDLEVLVLSHPRKMIRDTSRFKPFRAVTGGGTPSLKKLTEKLLGVAIQSGEHDSIQDAQATMRLYTMYKKRWEADILEKKFKTKNESSKKKNKKGQQDNNNVKEDNLLYE